MWVVICTGLAFCSAVKKILAPSSIHNYRILFLIIMKDEGPKVFKLLKNKLCLGFSQKVIPPRLISRRVLLPPANEVAGR